MFLKSKRFRFCSSKGLFTGPSVKGKYQEALRKLNWGLAGHVGGGTLMLLSSTAFGASPLTTTLFATLLWMQVVTSAKVTEIGSWVNLCKNVVNIEKTGEEGGHCEYILTTDASRLFIETRPKQEGEELPNLKELRELGILYVDETALRMSDPECQEIFDRDDLVVTLNESVKAIMDPPPGASKTAIPKLAEIYQRRQNAIKTGNQRISNLISNARPMEPEKMLERLGTASLAMGGAISILGATMYIASKNAPQPTATHSDVSSTASQQY